jgi:hypothetical protein
VKESAHRVGVSKPAIKITGGHKNLPLMGKEQYVESVLLEGVDDSVW